jgi:aminoglycoside N3'-acetyltransferase
MSSVASIAELAGDLGRLGIRAGAVLMVHASLRAIGPVEGRAAGVVQALDAAVGPSGTLLMVLGADDDWAWVNERPEADRASLLAGAVPFDALATPAEPDVGVLAEVFRTMPDTVVSSHPEGRFAARGRLADEFVRDVPWHDYYGPGSPLHRLVDAGGSVLRLGADTNTVTLLHYAEYLAEVPAKRRVRRYRRVAGRDGPEIRCVDCLDDTHGIVDWPDGDYFAAILADYVAARGIISGRAGAAASELLDAADLVSFASGWMTGRLGHRT